MSTKQSPRKVTLGMLKGKPIATSVPVIHYHASDDELEEIYPSTDEEKRSTPESTKTPSKATSSPSKSAHQSFACPGSDHRRKSSTETAAVGSSAESTLPEGTPPSLDPWKVLSDIKGKITKTFEEKLSEIKSDKKKRRRSRAESSSVSDTEDQGAATPCDEKAEDKRSNEQAAAAHVRRRGNPARYVGFSGVKTGLKDKSTRDESVESVESGIEASEFPESGEKEAAASRSGKDSPTAEGASLPPPRYARSVVFPKRLNFKSMFSRSMKQLVCQATYKCIAALVAICCIYWIVPLAEYTLGFTIGVFATITLFDVATKLKKILTTLPDERSVSSRTISVLEIPAVEEHAVVERFQGWMNELPYSYEPGSYRVARTKSVFFRLEGSVLRVMETRTKVPKKAVWDEPKHKLKFVKRRVYNLAGARVELLPHGLARRRRWSKKYPICVALERRALICNVALKSAAPDESCPTDSRSRRKLIPAASDTKKRGERWQEDAENDDEICFIDAEGERVSGGRLEGGERGEGRDSEEDYSDDDGSGICQPSNGTGDGDVDDDRVRVRVRVRVAHSQCLLRSGERRGQANDGKGNEKNCKEHPKEATKMRENIRRIYASGSRRKQRAARSIVEKWNKRKGNWKNHEEREQQEGEEADEEEEGVMVEKEEEAEAEAEAEEDGEELEEEEEEEEDEEEEEEEEEDETAELDEEEEEYEEEEEEEEKEKEKAEEEEEEGAEREEEDDEEEEVEDEDEEYFQVAINESNETEREGVKGEGKGKEKEKVEGKKRERRVRKGRKTKEELLQSRAAKSGLKKKYSKSGRGEGKGEIKMYMFARTDREKEDWYRRLVSAASRGEKKQDSSSGGTPAWSDLSSGDASGPQKTGAAESRSCFAGSASQESATEMSYNVYMSKYLESGHSPAAPPEDGVSLSGESTLWINCLIARVLFDLRKCPETIGLIQAKIQRKLSNIKLPYFMECLLVSEVAIGQGSPVIRSVSKPTSNERGLWLDFDVTYKGSLTMTVETKLNLMKLARSGSVAGTASANANANANASAIDSAEKQQDVASRSAMFDSELEDTPETSTEDDDEAGGTQLCGSPKDTASTQSSGKKFLSMVDRIAANKYFQHATELSYVRKAMEGVSNTEIRLMVTVSSIEGCLSINIPPAPSDRLWYGFKPVPKVSLTVKPAVGERTVNIVYVTKWIETKLLREFEKLVVLPNMDDLVVSLCPNYPYTTVR